MRGPAERVHGGLHSLDAEAQALLARAERVADFSVNLNAYGPPEALLAAVRDAALDVYPDPLARAPRRAWADALASTPECIAVGHGAADLFWALARALLAPGQRVLMVEPTFSEFRLAAESCGAHIERLWLREEDGFALPSERFLEAARGARAVYLCAPNNPTGSYVGIAQLMPLARALPETTLVLDQSFLALSDHAEDAAQRLPDNVVCVRSLTKDFALAGLRIGLVWAAASLIAQLERMRPTWSTGAPAQAALAVAAAPAQHAFVAESWRRLAADRDVVTALMRAHGYAPIPSTTAYQLVRVGDAPRFCRRLLAHGVIARDCSSFGLPDHVRLAARPAADVAQLGRALAAL
jgi:histidinol-phosphate/aromatic aminotransferase/cobyric acid decarboxylase-like protein